MKLTISAIKWITTVKLGKRTGWEHYLAAPVREACWREEIEFSGRRARATLTDELPGTYQRKNRPRANASRGVIFTKRFPWRLSPKVMRMGA